MTNSTTPDADRTAQAPPARPDLTGMRLSHRAILGDIDRLAALLRAPEASRVPPARAGAIATYVHRYDAAVRHHHRNEDDRLWPVVADEVGGAVDLSRYVGDHHALDRLQDAVDETAARYAEHPARHARPLAALLAEQRDLLVEHVGAEERHLFPVILRRVSAARYAAAEAEIHRSTPPELGAWLRPWLWRYATADERRLLSPASAIQPLLAVYTAHEKLAFGPVG
ncbi:hemerythrin domain-containing protein [Streptomyces sp. G45]|uniref:hemerythrin domain-containing protein n=1 Tax=Streptomyces sp. G45 TaxID=3406627 RepID=UPI003C1E6AE4